jgi:cysteine synthase
VVDPENSAFYRGWADGDATGRTTGGSRIEGIGRPRVEPSFLPSVIDHMIQVPDAASVAAMRWCSALLGRSVGGSTGTAMWGAVALLEQMRHDGRAGSVVVLLCDGGERYRDTYGDDTWLAAQGLDIGPHLDRLHAFLS